MDIREALAEIAADVAREAGALALARRSDAGIAVSTKSSLTDMVSDVDHECEALIVQRIMAARPDDAILGEEGAERPGISGFRWVVDPLDGTTNYLYGRGAFAVSIGVEQDGAAVAGAVYDPQFDELFAAVRGDGATLNGAPIRHSGEDQIETALVGTGFSYDATARAHQGQVVARLLPAVRDIRRAGSAALDLCAVACGRLDAYYEAGLNPWDMCAGALIVEEAGGRTGFVAFPGGTRALVAAGPAMWEPLARIVCSMR